jgi:predicted nuclease with TOPRIM domain
MSKRASTDAELEELRRRIKVLRAENDQRRERIKALSKENFQLRQLNGRLLADNELRTTTTTTTTTSVEVIEIDDDSSDDEESVLEQERRQENINQGGTGEGSPPLSPNFEDSDDDISQ